MRTEKEIVGLMEKSEADSLIAKDPLYLLWKYWGPTSPVGKILFGDALEGIEVSKTVN